jgi:hypothetical protein
MSSSLFNQHGECQISIVNPHLIRIEAFGPWNAEFFDSMHLQLKQLVPQFDVNNFTVLVIPCGEAIAVKEGMDKHIAFLKASNTKAAAIVTQHIVTKSVSYQLFDFVYTQGGVNHQFFEDEPTAVEWLQQQLTHN